jgi:heme/copper-type cytochrome/quinol oxidase subunit 2
MDDARPFGRGFRTVTVAGVLCSFTAAALAVTGAVPMAPIFLPLRTENYYFWQMLFTLPMLITVWIVTSMIVHILGGGRKRGGSLKKTLGVFGFAQAAPLLLVWTVQTVIAVFYVLGMGQQEMVDILSAPSTAQTVFLAVFGAALAWSFLLACLAASVSQKVKWPAALFLGVLAEALSVGPVVIFLR